MSSELRRDSIGTSHIVFFVVAAAAPLSAVLGVSPAAFALGNGPAVPMVFLLVGLIYILFSAAFTAMSPLVMSASGFYAYVAKGLGKPVAVATAAVALLSYQAISIGCYAVFGYFFQLMASEAFGITVPWWAAALLLCILIQACGRRAINFSGSVLAVCMAGEIIVLLILSIAILFTHDISTAPPPETSVIFGPGLGVSIVFVVTSFIGFEATVIFGEEARAPERTIPRATYISVLAISLFYGFCTWAITLYYGPENVARVARANPGEMYFEAMRTLLGPGVVFATRLLLLTSFSACILSLHATIARYLASMAREGLCASGLGKIHPAHGSPHVAGLVQIAGCAIAIVICALCRFNPYGVVFAWSGSLASIGILVMQIATAAAVAGFYLAHRPAGSRLRWLLAPVVSGLALFACLILVTVNLGLVSGTSSALIFLLPVLVLVTAVGGWWTAVRLKQREPTRYAILGLS